MNWLERIMVVAILSILTAIALPAYDGYVKRAELRAKFGPPSPVEVIILPDGTRCAIVRDAYKRNVAMSCDWAKEPPK